MFLLFSSFCTQSSIHVIFFNIMADGGDRADDDGKKTADASRDNTNKDNEHANRERYRQPCQFEP